MFKFFANNTWCASGVPLLFITYITEVAQLPLAADSKLVMYANDILL